MKKINPIIGIEKLTDDEIIALENDFLDKYCKPEKHDSLFKNLFKICRGHYVKLILAILLCAVQLSASLYIPIATANIIDALVTPVDNQTEMIVVNLIVSLALLLMNYPLQVLYRKYMYDASHSIEVTLRGAIIAKLQRLTISFNKRMESGRIQSKIMNNVDAIKGVISSLISNGTHVVINLVTVITVMIIKGNWWLLLFFIACAPISAISVKIFKNTLRARHREYRVVLEDAYTKVLDMVELVPVTKAHALENYEIQKMARQVGDVAKSGYKADMATGKFITVNWLSMQFFQLGCLALVIFMAINGTISIGDIALYQNYFEKFLSNINTVVNMAPTLTHGAEAVNSVGEILKSDETERDDGKKKLSTVKGEFVFKSAYFNYDDDDRSILNGLDLKVNAGETVALVGESGAGKSTIINLVSGFYFATDGSLLLDGNDMRDINLKSYRKHLAVVPQNSILFSGSIRENITYGSPEVSEERLQEIIDLACLRDVIDNLPNGVDTRIGEHGCKLSGGQRQRISIARALIRNPKVIIFDEATSALDTVSEKHIQTAIENLSKEKTTFIVAHRLSTVKNADKIAVIADGKCVEFGTYDELVAKKGEFYKFRQLQV